MMNSFDAVPSGYRPTATVGTRRGYDDAKALLAFVVIGVIGANLAASEAIATASMFHGATLTDAANTFMGFFFDKTKVSAASNLGASAGMLAAGIRLALHTPKQG